jgi:hypothetical protein
MAEGGLNVHIPNTAPRRAHALSLVSAEQMIKPIYCRRCKCQCPDSKELGSLPDLLEEGDIEAACKILRRLKLGGFCVCDYNPTGGRRIFKDGLDFEIREAPEKVDCNTAKPLFEQTQVGEVHKKAARKFLERAGVKSSEYEQLFEPRIQVRTKKRGQGAWWYSNPFLREALVVARYPRSDTDSKERREARYLLHLIERYEKGEKIGSNTDSQILFRIRGFADRVLQDESMEFIGTHGMSHIIEVAKSPFVGRLMNASKRKKTVQDLMLRVLDMAISDPSFVTQCHDSILFGKMDPLEREMYEQIGIEYLRGGNSLTSYDDGYNHYLLDEAKGCRDEALACLSSPEEEWESSLRAGLLTAEAQADDYDPELEVRPVTTGIPKWDDRGWRFFEFAFSPSCQFRLKVARRAGRKFPHPLSS